MPTEQQNVLIQQLMNRAKRGNIPSRNLYEQLSSYYPGAGDYQSFASGLGREPTPDEILASLSSAQAPATETPLPTYSTSDTRIQDLVKRLQGRGITQEAFGQQLSALDPNAVQAISGRTDPNQIAAILSGQPMATGGGQVPPVGTSQGTTPQPAQPTWEIDPNANAGIQQLRRQRLEGIQGLSGAGFQDQATYDAFVNNLGREPTAQEWSVYRPMFEGEGGFESGTAAVGELALRQSEEKKRTAESQNLLKQVMDETRARYDEQQKQISDLLGQQRKQTITSLTSGPESEALKRQFNQLGILQGGGFESELANRLAQLGTEQGTQLALSSVIPQYQTLQNLAQQGYLREQQLGDIYTQRGWDISDYARQAALAQQLAAMQQPSLFSQVLGPALGAGTALGVGSMAGKGGGGTAGAALL